LQNCFSGITIILIGCAGSVTTLKAQGFLLLSLVVAIVNLVNLVILEVGEWRGFLSPEDRNFIKDNGLDGLMYSAYLCTTASTVIAMITSFCAAQHAFCFQQILAEKEAKANELHASNIVHHHRHHGFDQHVHEPDDKVCNFHSRVVVLRSSVTNLTAKIQNFAIRTLLSGTMTN
jgi:hypothetical protein